MNGPKATYGPKADLALATFVKLVRAHNTVYRTEARHIRSDFGLTQPQFAVIEAIGHLGPLTMGELTAKLLVTGGNMTVVIDNLESCGHVQRQPDESDRRVTRVVLTRKGQALFDKIFPIHARHMERTFSVLTESEQRTLGKLLRKLGRHLEEHGVPEGQEN